MAHNRKLGRVSSHRKAMLRNLATDVIMYGKIETTVTRAKEVRSIVDELITLGKRGDLHARRQAATSYYKMLLILLLVKLLFKNYLMKLHQNMQIKMVDTLVF